MLWNHACDWHETSPHHKNVNRAGEIFSHNHGLNSYSTLMFVRTAEQDPDIELRVKLEKQGPGFQATAQKHQSLSQMDDFTSKRLRTTRAAWTQNITVNVLSRHRKVEGLFAALCTKGRMSHFQGLPALWETRRQKRVKENWFTLSPTAWNSKSLLGYLFRKAGGIISMTRFGFSGINSFLSAGISPWPETFTWCPFLLWPHTH